MQVNILEAKNRLSELVKAAQSGQSVVIANRGQPVAQLVAAGRGPVRRGKVEHVNDWLLAHPLPPHAGRTQAEIDAELAQEREAWG